MQSKRSPNPDCCIQMISKKVDDPSVKPFHETFPFALEWFLQEGKKKLQHNAYFPYDDYRERYAKRLKYHGAIKIRKYETEPRKTD